MLIGRRLRELRESRNLSQGDVEKRTGLLRCYTSRVENGHTVPSIETLEKYARAHEIPMYKLFLDGDGQPQKPPTSTVDPIWGANGTEQHELQAFTEVLSRLDDRQRNLLMTMASRMSRCKSTK